MYITAESDNMEAIFFVLWGTLVQFLYIEGAMLHWYIFSMILAEIWK